MAQERFCLVRDGLRQKGEYLDCIGFIYSAPFFGNHHFFIPEQFFLFYGTVCTAAPGCGFPEAFVVFVRDAVLLQNAEKLCRNAQAADRGCGFHALCVYYRQPDNIPVLVPGRAEVADSHFTQIRPDADAYLEKGEQGTGDVFLSTERFHDAERGFERVPVFWMSLIGQEAVVCLVEQDAHLLEVYTGIKEVMCDLGCFFCFILRAQFGIEYPVELEHQRIAFYLVQKAAPMLDHPFKCGVQAVQ